VTQELPIDDPGRFVRFVEPGGSLVVACSGGSDSMALLFAAELALRGTARITVAHLDHALRETSADDATFVASAARRLGLPCACERTDARPGAGESPEERARTLRYAFLERVALDADASVVMTAHHADDQAETVLLRAVTGTGRRGLLGIAHERPLGTAGVRLARPLLDVRKHRLRAWLEERDLAWREDVTNLDGNVRARLRHGSISLRSLAT
jgi:tRNA(Ile)-lysidine synthase